ncbi:MAG: Plug domain-containing protein [Candidatus Eisenbacteria bacterium]|uniref:Plug domain-containing protein n=1 Tax=Eiseniibacteriota bacterium TaxID=2212470 RepID=A0A7Y2H331_UNCEI|nr:Plug domain-containing protein [Candidatus Eisenbacteria bacterium]
MRRGLLVLGFLVGLHAACFAVSKANPGRTVLSGEEIRNAGLTRLADIVTLLPDWSAQSLEEFTWQTSPGGLTTPEEQGFLLFVDGHRVDLGLFGVQNLNRLPLGIQDIDFVEAFSSPMQLGASFSDRGVLHIHTRVPTRESLAYRTMAGSETGDPGPFRYTDLSTPNVERIGHDYTLSVGYGSADSVQTAAATLRGLSAIHYATDPKNLRRYERMAGIDFRVLESEGGMASASYRRGGVSLSLLGSVSNLEDAFYLESVGREFPTNTESRVASFLGNFDKERWRVQGRLSFSGGLLAKRENNFNIDPSWRQDRATAGIIATYMHPFYELSAGSELEYLGVESDYPLESDNIRVVRFFGNAGTSLWDHHRTFATLSLEGGRLDQALNLSLGHSWNTKGMQVEAQASYSERIPELDPRIWRWQERGYGFLDDLGVDLTTTPLTPSELWALDAKWSVRTTQSRLSIAPYLRRHQDLTLNQGHYRFVGFDDAFWGNVKLVQVDAGSLLGVTIDAEHKPHPLTKLTTRIHMQSASGHPAYVSAWRTQPQLQGFVRLDWHLFENLLLQPRLRFRSETQWDRYEAAAAESQGLYQETVPAVLLFDLTAKKWAWHRRLVGSLSLQNLFDRKAAYHPAGYESEFRFVVSGTVFWN